MNTRKEHSLAFITLILPLSNILLFGQDNNGNGVIDIYEDELAQMFAPIIHYHDGNPLFPMRVDDIYTESYFNSQGEDKALPITSHTPQGWKTYFETVIEPLNLQPNVYYNIISKTMQGYGGSSTQYYIIEYWFYYPFNDAVNIHEGDWEHVSVIIDNENPVYAQPVGATFHHHYEIDRFSWQSIENDGNHIHVYVGGRTVANVRVSPSFGILSINLDRDFCDVGGYEEITGASFPHEGSISRSFHINPFFLFINQAGGFSFYTDIKVTEYINSNRIVHYNDYDLINLRGDDSSLWWLDSDAYFGASGITVSNETAPCAVGLSANYSFPFVSEKAPKNPKHSRYWDDYPATTYVESAQFYKNEDYLFGLHFDLLETSLVTVKMWNILGIELNTMVDEVLEAGVYDYDWNWKDYGGIPVGDNPLFYRIEVSPSNLLYSYWYFKRMYSDITFWNKHDGGDAGGTLTVQTIGTIPSGSTEQIDDGTEYAEVTDDKVFENWNGTGKKIKHHDWNGDFGEYRFNKTFTTAEEDQNANYEELKTVSITSDFDIDLEIKDPWWVNPDTDEQPDPPIFHTISAGTNYEVFLDQDPNQGMQYYSLRAPDTLMVTQSDIWVFDRW